MFKSNDRRRCPPKAGPLVSAATAKKRTSRARRCDQVLALAVWAFCAPPSVASDDDILWTIVHDRCVPEQAKHQTPGPCAAVNVAKGYAIFKDRVGIGQFLLIPTARISGIEDPAILAQSAPTYWQHAWDARHNVINRIGRPLDGSYLSLAVNSAYGRTQKQLHVHIDCIAPWVRSVLAAHAGNIGESWSRLPVPLAGHVYRARRVATLDQPGTDPFRLVADGIPGARSDMARESLIVIGANFSDGSHGFFVLETQADLSMGNRGSAEELQDHDCVVARGYR
jgi:CDP-diacylglycerol pyrophosphatase